MSQVLFGNLVSDDATDEPRWTIRETSQAELRLMQVAHFEVWFELTYGQPVGVAYPGLPVLLVLPLYEPPFMAHECEAHLGYGVWHTGENRRMRCVLEAGLR